MNHVSGVDTTLKEGKSGSEKKRIRGRRGEKGRKEEACKTGGNNSDVESNKDRIGRDVRLTPRHHQVHPKKSSKRAGTEAVEQLVTAPTEVSFAQCSGPVFRLEVS